MLKDKMDGYISIQQNMIRLQVDLIEAAKRQSEMYGAKNNIEVLESTLEVQVNFLDLLLSEKSLIEMR